MALKSFFSQTFRNSPGQALADSDFALFLRIQRFGLSA
jgi:hypothetical protein